MDITFTKTNIQVIDIYKPLPAKKFLPDWYKNIPSYKDNKKVAFVEGTEEKAGTIKKCMPVFDAMTSGYIIPSHVDIWVTQRNGIPFYEWADISPAPITWHPVWQAEGHPSISNNFDAAKFNNPWAIKTPKGYSSLFISPMHSDTPIKILPGIVDTDQYTATINFPFTLVYNDFEGLIPAGTPIAQIIPFKRESWEQKDGGKKDFDEAYNKQSAIITRFYDAYKSLFWSKKRYN